MHIVKGQRKTVKDKCTHVCTDVCYLKLVLSKGNPLQACVQRHCIGFSTSIGLGEELGDFGKPDLGMRVDNVDVTFDIRHADLLEVR